MSEVGEVLLGKYRVERELGRGGMGRVLAARHIELDELVAIKLILPEYAREDDVVERFMREARASAKIHSEHVCKVSDVGRLPTGEPYMVMEMLRGKDFEEVLKERGALPISETVEYIMQALEALAEAHAAGIVHRDLKPANLFLTRRRNGTPCVKVLDFGISKLVGSTASSSGGMTKTTGMLGSPLFMSPEQIESSKAVDERTDIWALGVILYQLLTNMLPFYGDSIAQLVLAIITKAPDSMREAAQLDIPEELESVVMHCLEKNRDVRYANIAELATALAPFGPDSVKLSLQAIVSFGGNAPDDKQIPKEPIAAKTPKLLQTTPSAAVSGSTAASGTAVNAANVATIITAPTVGKPASSRLPLYLVVGLVGIALVVGSVFAVLSAGSAKKRKGSERAASTSVSVEPKELKDPNETKGEDEPEHEAPAAPTVTPHVESPEPEPEPSATP